ncbi:molybdenum cofactor guanylyltransferase [Congregibacter variabilis]|uniref:Molybdenum cofactor guanylyltransferase n=1 Tax=Congregibacter variabilis TaxID=3081200 RepID=A0ABZ0I365_9GAMM|nr:molybdenum cofactor guanylyltransferase [Congregibacter sp. IMCC43200]
MVSDDYPTQSLSRDKISPRGKDQRDNFGTVGLVLCGGAGRRMAGRDKGLMDIHGRPSVAWALALLQPLSDSCFISANRNQKRYAQLGMGEVIGDLRPGFQGPLAGLEAIVPALEATSGAERLLLLPCDLPMLSADVPRRLLEELDARLDTDIIYARTDSQSHYLCAALRTRVLGTLGEQLDQGNRAVHRWYAQCSSAALEFSGELAKGFVNMNRAEDLGLQPGLSAKDSEV